jgi:hypothetical protein
VDVEEDLLLLGMRRKVRQHVAAFGKGELLLLLLLLIWCCLESSDCVLLLVKAFLGSRKQISLS